MLPRWAYQQLEPLVSFRLNRGKVGEQVMCCLQGEGTPQNGCLFCCGTFLKQTSQLLGRASVIAA